MAARQLPLTPLAAPWSEPPGSGLAWPKSGIAYLVDTDLADTDLANTDWYKQENVKDARQR